MVASVEQKDLLELYTVMLKGRAFEQKVMDLFTAGKIPGFLHVGIGQEAIAAGVCRNLNFDDCIVTTHRGHLQAVAKGVDLKRAMAELFGKQTGYCKGKAGSMHLTDKETGLMMSTAIVGGGFPVSLGFAFSAQQRGTKQVTVCFFGDGSANEGTFHESLNLASLWKLPLIFCCENNGWSQFTSQRRTTIVPDVAKRAEAYNMASMSVDGDDAIAVYENASKAIERARNGEGPTLLECKTHRWYGHYVGDAQKYRDREDIENSRRYDPIVKLETRLIEQKVPQQLLDEQRNRVNSEIEEAVKFAEESPLPEVKGLLEDVYYTA